MFCHALPHFGKQEVRCWAHPKMVPSFASQKEFGPKTIQKTTRLSWDVKDRKAEMIHTYPRH